MNTFPRSWRNDSRASSRRRRITTGRHLSLSRAGGAGADAMKGAGGPLFVSKQDEFDSLHLVKLTRLHLAERRRRRRVLFANCATLQFQSASFHVWTLGYLSR